MATATSAAFVRRRILVRGIVQGVGFRPFVFQLAQRIGVRGFVCNTSSGVTIEAEASLEALDEFLEALPRRAPPLARIEGITATELPATGDSSFEIRHSQAREGEFALVSPDVATCEDCRRDFSDRRNRRYGYPFTNCTNCGPRYTIVQDIPYDRPLTTMAEFRMCSECEAEYHDPANRRFHAQPNACPACGPGLALARSGSSLPEAAAYESGERCLALLRDARRLLREGAILAVKGLGGFQLACDAENDDAVRRLRQRKKRSDKPFALMARDADSAGSFCFLSPADRQLLLRPEHPIVIVPRRPESKISSAVAPGNHTLGVMLAYTPLHLLLFGDGAGDSPEFSALVMTSGNFSDGPIVTSNQEAWQRLGPIADWFLLHNRGIATRVDDSVARAFANRPRLLRRSRGYAPQPILLDRPLRQVLACGGEMKNTFCLTTGRYAILSQHIGDADNYETLEFFRETLASMKKLFRVEPQAVAHDLHPLYLTTRLAAEMPLPKIAVQHHHAHIASCMAENGLRGQVLGVAFDGTGYGADGQIWGGEFLSADYGGYRRLAHLRYVPLAGGDAAVRQPWRAALGWLREAFGEEQLPPDLPLFQQVPHSRLGLVLRMLERDINTVLTSSCGRLFDAVASLIGLRQQVTFEGQAAIELESVTQAGVEEAYSFQVEEGRPAAIDMRPAIREIVHDIGSGMSAGSIASRFHNTMAAVIVEVCRRMRDQEGLERVCLSGGTFQNLYLLERAVAGLRGAGFEVFLHAAVPPNDGGIALGQAVIANEVLNSGA